MVGGFDAVNPAAIDITSEDWLEGAMDEAKRQVPVCKSVQCKELQMGGACHQ